MPPARNIELTATDDDRPSGGNHGGNHGHVAKRWEAVLDAALIATAEDIAAKLVEVPMDVVEAALADAIQRASVDREWTTEALVRELQARRQARAGVVDLEAERARRGR